MVVVIAQELFPELFCEVLFSFSSFLDKFITSHFSYNQAQLHCILVVASNVSNKRQKLHLLPGVFPARGAAPGTAQPSVGTSEMRR